MRDDKVDVRAEATKSHWLQRSRTFVARWAAITRLAEARNNISNSQGGGN